MILSRSLLQILQFLEQPLRHYTKNFAHIWALLVRFYFLLSDNLAKKKCKRCYDFSCCMCYKGELHFMLLIIQMYFFPQQLAEGIKPSAIGEGGNENHWKQFSVVGDEFILITIQLLASFTNISDNTQKYLLNHDS